MQERKDYWLIYFEDDELRPEIFTDEQTARARQKIVNETFTCTLFKQVENN